jgi:hypothetical protein
MHYRFLATFNKDVAATSAQARRYVSGYLTDCGFVHDDSKRWGDGFADWFVIGGRWSGELSRHAWAKAFAAQMDAIEQEHDVQVWGAYYGDKGKQYLQQQLAERSQAMWDAAAPPAYQGIPIQRDTSKADGYEDDAMLLTQDLYDGLLKEYEGASDCEYHADLDYEVVSLEMVGAKRLVVVDYHN